MLGYVGVVTSAVGIAVSLSISVKINNPIALRSYKTSPLVDLCVHVFRKLSSLIFIERKMND